MGYPLLAAGLLVYPLDVRHLSVALDCSFGDGVSARRQVVFNCSGGLKSTRDIRIRLPYTTDQLDYQSAY